MASRRFSVRAIRGSSIELDLERLTFRFLSKASALRRKDEYCRERERLRSTLPADARLWVHGEDFVELLHWLIFRLRGGPRTVPRDLLGRVLLLAVPLEEAAAQPLFVELKLRLS